jgi:aryl-alcohol dehydrogenase-like predicted oxidoreductase
MKKLQLGSSDLWVTHLCMGTMTFGEQNTEAEGFAILDAAFDAGINFVDTAEIYPVPVNKDTFSRTEAIVGKWLKTKPRNDVVLATKMSGPSRAANWIRNGDLDFMPKNVDEAVHNSLKLMDVDHIDLYQLHWPARNVPLFGDMRFDPKKEKVSAAMEDTLAGLDKHVKAGKIRAIGLSNETPWGVSEFIKQSEIHGTPRIASIQNGNSLLNRSFENGLDEVCFRENVGLLAYSPLSFGQLTGKYVDDREGAQGRLNKYSKDWSPRYVRESVYQAVAEYAALARANGMSPTQMAIAWSLSQWYVASTIVGATSVAQLQEQLTAQTITLSPEVMAGIEDIHTRIRNPAF